MQYVKEIWSFTSIRQHLAAKQNRISKISYVQNNVQNVQNNDNIKTLLKQVKL